MRLLASSGAMVKGRCRATNLCDYCARLSAVEWSEMLALDALDGDAPAVWLVLTTRTATLDTEAFYSGRRKVLKALQRRWSACRYLAVVEFTTGYGALSGGDRRPHWNLLLKGVPAECAEEAGAIAARVWCAHVDALPRGQFSGAIHEAGGLMRYLALHFLKESQRPPEGWSGQRVTFSTTASRTGGYFTEPVWKVRRRAQEALRVKREVNRAIREGLEPVEAQTVAEARHERNGRLRWEAVVLNADRETGELLSVRAMRGGEPTVLRPDPAGDVERRLTFGAEDRAYQEARDAGEFTTQEDDYAPAQLEL